MSEATRPVPRPTALSKPFWDACREKKLLVQRCTECGTYLFTPRTFCSECQSLDLEWTESSGRGQIVTYTTIWRPQTPAFEAPYVAAVVRLDEGYEMISNIVNTEPSEVKIGDAVRVHFVEVSPTVTLPCFEPATVEGEL